MEADQVGANGKLDEGGSNVQALPMQSLAARARSRNTTPEQRSLIASRAARVRWKRRARHQSKRLRQIMETGAKAYTELVQELAHLPSPRTPNASRAARRLLGAFSNLYLFQGGDLPVEAQQLLALTVGELQRQEREEQSGAADVT